MKKIVVAFLVLALGAGIVFGALFVDRMAVNYITGQRPGRGRRVLGRGDREGRPGSRLRVLGFTRASEEPPGLRIMRPWEMAREIGLERGDVVTSVEGETFSSSRELMSHLVRNFEAGETVRLTAVSQGEPERTLTMTLRAFVRHPAIWTCLTKRSRSPPITGICCVGGISLRRSAATDALAFSCMARTPRVFKRSRTAPNIGIIAGTG